LKGLKIKREGVYLAHDSFGVALYGGRANIFHRLRSHKRKYNRELVYYSFYIIADKTHEREIENVILRAAGPQLVLNQRRFGMELSQEVLKIMSPAHGTIVESWPEAKGRLCVFDGGGADSRKRAELA
jgi:hypothetical protein